MADEQHVFEAMEYLQWRDVLLPCMEWEHRFAHESVQHHIIYRAGVAIDMLGAQGRTFSYVLPLRQGILQAPFTNAFTGIYYRFYEAYRDKSPDTLIDPVHGALTAVPGEWNASADPGGMDGVTVRVTFTEDTGIDGAATDQPPTFENLEGQAADLDEETAAVPWKRDTPPLPTTDPLSAASGLLQQGTRMIERTKAQFTAVAQRAQEVESAAQELETTSGGAVKTNSVRLAARKLRLDATRAANSAPQDLPGAVISTTLEAPKTLLQICSETGMDLADLIRVNAGIARAPFVAAGTTIFIVKKRKRRR